MSVWRVGLVMSGVLASLPWALRARADAMDISLSRLSRGDCTATLDLAALSLGDADGPALGPDDAAFQRLAGELSTAVAMPVLEPVITSGPRGFDVALETSVTDIDQRASAWRRGTRGRGVPETCNGRNDDVRPVLLGNQLRFSKGLPLGLAASASLGRLHDTGTILIGLGLKLALLEEALGGRVPDLALRAALTRTVGAGELALYATTVDAVVSKNWVLAERVVLAPFIGAGMLWTRASARTVDLTPNIDARACQAGVDPVCSAAGLGASAADLAHDVRFARLSIVRYRAFGGVSVRYRFLALTGAVTLALPRPEFAAAPRQWTVSVAPMVSF